MDSEKDASDSDESQYEEKEVNRDNYVYEGTWNLMFRHQSATKKISFAWYDLGPSQIGIPQEIDFEQTYSIPVNDTERANIGKSKIIYNGKSHKGIKVMQAIFNANSGFYYFYDRSTSILHELPEKVKRIRGGFQTRSTAQIKGEVPLSMKDHNNGVVSRTYTSFPKVWIDGSAGGCCVLAAYYLNAEFSKEMMEHLMQNSHDKLKIHPLVNVTVTNGTHQIIRDMNERLQATFFRKMYPTEAHPRMFENVNTLFGDSKNTGKFLVEIGDVEPTTLVSISHFVSLDTHAMEIYDPMCEDGAIPMYRNSNDHCIILEMLVRNPKECCFMNIWRLEDKVHSSGKKRDSANGPSMDLPEVKKIKKRNRKIRIKKNKNDCNL